LSAEFPSSARICGEVAQICLFNESVSTILASRLNPNAEQIVGDRHGVFRRNRSTTDCIFCVRHLLEKNGNRAHHLFTHLKNGYDSVRKEVLCNNLIKFGILMKPARLITNMSE
jgi:hypothetical protein